VDVREGCVGSLRAKVTKTAAYKAPKPVACFLHGRERASPQIIKYTGVPGPWPWATCKRVDGPQDARLVSPAVIVRVARERSIEAAGAPELPGGDPYPCRWWSFDLSPPPSKGTLPSDVYAAKIRQFRILGRSSPVEAGAREETTSE
jgi:hypothetical protein